MSKIDIDKFICNLFAQGALPKGSRERVYVENALYDCGYEYYGGEIVERKEEPKFKAGNWYQCTKDFFGKGVTFDKNTAYYCAKEGCLQNEYGCHIAIVKDLYDNFKLWVLEDAKPGDVLVCDVDKKPFIFKGLLNSNHPNWSVAYCGIDSENLFLANTGNYLWTADNVKPATKEQRDILMKAMADAGYTFDFEKKELKEIELNPNDLIEESYKQQADDLIDTVTKKSTWSEKDEEVVNNIIDYMKPMPIFFESTKGKSGKEYTKEFVKEAIKWLKSLKERMAE